MERFFNTELITEFMKEHKLSKKAFCKLCGFGTTTLNRIFNSDMSLRLPVLRKLSMGMNVEIKELLYKKIRHNALFQIVD